jgi:predicted transposase/invertase (TIGR01784 family)
MHSSKEPESMKPLISFDYAIKHLLCNKTDHDIVESFLSAVFVECGYLPVKIKAVLESESNKEDSILKRSTADMVVESQDGERYIVEVERAFSANFPHQAVFNTSRLIVDSLQENEDYTTLNKIVHISLLFDDRNMDEGALIRHSKTIFHNPRNAKPIDVHMSGRGSKWDLSNIIPEYIVIVIPLFDGIVKNDFDEWLYIMRNSDTRKNSKLACVEKVRNRLNHHNMSDKELRKYLLDKKEMFAMRDSFDGGKQQGKQEGKMEEKINNTMEMLKLNLAPEIISQVTHLSLEKIEKLKNSL